MKNPKRTPKKTTNRKLNIRNSRILHDTMVALGALKENSKLHDLPMNEIQVHLLDKSGDGIVLCLEYDELTGELEKTFHNTEEAVEVELEELDACASPENVKEFLQKRIEETISEEYDEIFHNSDNDDDEPPLLN